VIANIIRLAAFALFGLLGATSQSEAHRPYFTQRATIQLPDRTDGELRILRGDGIFFGDPGRVLALDQHGRLIARSHKAVSLVISCPKSGGCRAIDLSHDVVLELDPATLREGAIVPGFTDDERDQLWELEDGEQSWGFRTRPASFVEMVEGELAQARQNPLIWPPLIVMGCLGGVLAFIGARRPPPASRTVALGLWIIEWFGRLAGVLLILLVCLYWAALQGMSDMLWFGSISAGVLIVIILRAAVRWLPQQRRSEPTVQLR
jgi:hypothetical protein